MHIKKVVIKGFKSYLQASNPEDFDPSVNAIVGSNGSGKSNFYEAIRFVLSESLTNLRAEERQQLLFERAGQPALEAQVAIHFDNTDGRFPIESSEVILRRIIGRAKEGYYCINDKRASKQEVVNLLESAGFSRSNPYYIVQQGKVNDLTLMKPKERLELLKEVAGTRVYEEKKLESQKLIREGDSKKEKCAELLEYIEERLQDLESEKEELAEFETLDKQKRCIEYNLYEKQLAEIEEKLEELEETRQQTAKDSTNAHDEALETQSSIKEAERKLKKIAGELQQLVKDKIAADEERQELIEQQAKLEFIVNEESNNASAESNKVQQLQAQLVTLEAEIKDTESKLQAASEELDAALEEERKITENMTTSETRLHGIYAKLGRSAQYNSKKERDTAITKELEQIDQAITQKQKQIEECDKEIDETASLMQEKAQEVKDKETKLKDTKKALDDRMTTCTKHRRERDSLNNQRKEAWRDDAELESKMKSVREDISMYERSLYSTVDRATYKGLLAVKQYAEKENLKGYYGPLLELFKCNEAVQTAVEVTAGNSLFFVVVDNDDTATTLIQHINQEKAGRVTFIPLSRVQRTHHDLPKTANSVPLMDMLTFAPMFGPALKQVFGRTLLCSSLEVASAYARTQNIDCVTKEGDKVNKRGALTGGFYDFRTSRISTMKHLAEKRAEISDIEKDLHSAKEQAGTTDTRINNILGQLQLAEGQLQQLQGAIDQLNFEIYTTAKELRALDSFLVQRKKTRSDMQLSLEQLKQTQNELKQELRSEYQAQLSNTEKDELKTLNEQIIHIQQEFITQSSQRAKIETERNALLHRLNENLLQRKQELVTGISPSRLADLLSEHARHASELAALTLSATAATTRYNELEESIFEKTKQMTDFKNEIEKLNQKEYTHAEQIQNQSKSTENFFNKKSLLLQQKDENVRKIRELGSIPSGYEKYQKPNITRLMTLLHQTNEQLRKYSNVNKKALDQWRSFTKQKKELNSRMEDLDASSEAIESLITTLDQQKDEAISITLKGVSSKFAETFKQLVPFGRAEMSVLIGSGESDDENSESDEENENSEESDEEDIEASRKKISRQVRRYQGVAIEAAFTEGEALPVELLSGGQKAVTALALIFAIQKCDPAPFYLFDEIDSALDPIYRTAVAKMISEQDAQFIISTFKPELLDVAENFYGVAMQDKASVLQTITKQQAKDAIIGIENEEAVEFDDLMDQSDEDD